MTGAIFVDTNVLVYSRDANHPHKQSLAAKLLERLWRERAGRISIQVLNEYYVTATRRLRPGIQPEEAWDDVTALLSWAPQTIDAPLLARAREAELRYRLSWWDCMIVAAAHLQGCATLVTEDLRDGMLFFDRVRVQNPFASEVADGADGTSRRKLVEVTPRHRPRGRPRIGGGLT